VRNLARVPGDSFGFEPDKTLTKLAHDHLARNNAAGGEIGFTFSKGFKPFNGRPSVVRSIFHAVTVGECRVQFQPMLTYDLTVAPVGGGDHQAGNA